ncbi:hypothetical protein F5146DRAFT_1140943 [Armillaria mellea]|nr:hypothetical protein F5146DRAFT_1140943 [Armillaria mellea]
MNDHNHPRRRRLSAQRTGSTIRTPPTDSNWIYWTRLLLSTIATITDDDDDNGVLQEDAAATARHCRQPGSGLAPELRHKLLQRNCLPEPAHRMAALEAAIQLDIICRDILGIKPASVVALVSHLGYLRNTIEVVPDSSGPFCVRMETRAVGFCGIYSVYPDVADTRLNPAISQCSEMFSRIAFGGLYHIQAKKADGARTCDSATIQDIDSSGAFHERIVFHILLCQTAGSLALASSVVIFTDDSIYPDCHFVDFPQRQILVSVSNFGVDSKNQHTSPSLLVKVLGCRIAHLW